MAEGQTAGGSKIARVKKGDTTRTLMHTDLANELIDAVNKLLDMQVSPGSAGKFVYSEGNVMFQLNTTDCGAALAADDTVDGGGA